MDTSSEQYRHECEVRWLAKRTTQQIVDYLKEVEKARGKAAAEKLRNDTREEWKRSRK